MVYTNKVKKASEIAMHAHAGQVDKGGYPYIMHPIHLAEQMAFEDEIIVALLHDAAEDHPEYWDIIKSSFDKHIVEALDVLNRNSEQNRGKTYAEYIRSVARNNLATKIKLVDLYHNMELSRWTEPDGIKALPIYKRYLSAYEHLTANMGIELKIERVGTDEIEIKTRNRNKHNFYAYRIDIDTPYYFGSIKVLLSSILNQSKPSVIECSGEIRTKTGRYPPRECNNSGNISCIARERLVNTGKPVVKEHTMLFKTVEFNRDIKIGITVDFVTGQVISVKLYENINTLH